MLKIFTLIAVAVFMPVFYFIFMPVFYYIAMPVLILQYEILSPLVKLAKKLVKLITLLKYQAVGFINNSWDILLKATYILLLLIIIVMGGFELYFVTKTTNKNTNVEIDADTVIIIKTNR